MSSDWEKKCVERGARDAEAFARDGLPFDHPDCRFYKDGHGKPTRFPGGLTVAEWEQGPARSSALRAADLPED